MGEKKLKSSKIGLKNVHIAEFFPETNKFGKPIRFKTIKEMVISVNVAENEEYNDDELFEILDSFENFEVEATFTDLTPAEQAFLFGWRKKGALKFSGSKDNPPWIAFMGERSKQDKTKRFFKYFKGKSRLESESAKSKGGGSVEAQSDKIIIKCGPLPDDFPVAEYQSEAKVIVDEADPEYADEGKTWYDEVVPGQTIEGGLVTPPEPAEPDDTDD